MDVGLGWRAADVCVCTYMHVCMYIHTHVHVCMYGYVGLIWGMVVRLFVYTHIPKPLH